MKAALPIAFGLALAPLCAVAQAPAVPPPPSFDIAKTADPQLSCAQLGAEINALSSATASGLDFDARAQALRVAPPPIADQPPGSVQSSLAAGAAKIESEQRQQARGAHLQGLFEANKC